VPLAEWVRIPPPPSEQATPIRPVRFERTTVSSKHQVTIPSVPFNAAGLRVGDRLHGHADGPGRVILERIESDSTTLALDGLGE
jgi:bifunctional DNA-binding transcriptional regulator/antitoxin component of YhaV-PrlF toxin-antitoxin module